MLSPSFDNFPGCEEKDGPLRSVLRCQDTLDVWWLLVIHGKYYISGRQTKNRPCSACHASSQTNNEPKGCGPSIIVKMCTGEDGTVLVAVQRLVTHAVQRVTRLRRILSLCIGRTRLLSRLGAPRPESGATQPKVGGSARLLGPTRLLCHTMTRNLLFLRPSHLVSAGN